MRRMDNWVFLALLALVTISQVHCNCIDREQYNSHCSYSDNHDWRYSDHESVFPGAEIVTYGDPCYCRDSIPYSVQVPKISTTSQPQESLKSYGFSVEVPPPPSSIYHNSFPVQIQTPVTHTSSSATLRLPSLPYSIESVRTYTESSRIPPMSAAIQTPVTPPKETTKLVGLSAKVDRVLVPACPVEGCPLCSDVKAHCW